MTRGKPPDGNGAGRWPLLAILPLLALCLAAIPAAAWSGEVWHGIRVAEEHRCSHYDRGDYRYPQSVELAIIADQAGKVYGPYTGRTFASRRQTDIEHIIAVSEAHDSGLCAASPARKREFARDLLNLTLATPEVNRCSKAGKCARDAAEWLPALNRCWFAARIVAVRQKYDLTIDAREADALEAILSGCDDIEMVVLDSDPIEIKTAPVLADGAGMSPDEVLARWDDNGNGRITCKEARRHGIAPVPRSHAAYRFMRDGDGDGVVCE